MISRGCAFARITGINNTSDSRKALRAKDQIGRVAGGWCRSNLGKEQEGIDFAIVRCCSFSSNRFRYWCSHCVSFGVVVGGQIYSKAEKKRTGN